MQANNVEICCVDLLRSFGHGFNAPSKETSKIVAANKYRK